MKITMGGGVDWTFKFPGFSSIFHTINNFLLINWTCFCLCNTQVPQSSKKKNKAKGTLSNIVRQNSGRIKHRKGKQQTEVKVPIQVLWESRNKSKDLSKNLCPYPKLLMNLPPFFQANSFLHLQKRKKTPPSGSSELFSCLFPLLKRMHSSNSALFLVALFASLEKCMSRRNSNSSEKKIKATFIIL